MLPENNDFGESYRPLDCKKKIISHVAVSHDFWILLVNRHIFVWEGDAAAK